MSVIIFALFTVTAVADALPYPMITLREAPFGYTPVTNAEEFRSMTTDGHYILLSDIDLSGETTVPLGNDDAPFTGTFDGNGHKLSGALISGNYKYSALFGKLENATIKNLIVENITVQHNADESEELPDELYAAGIAAFAKGSVIRNCSVSGTISANAASFAYAGGIAAYIDDTDMKDLANYASVGANSKSFAYSAGICAYLRNGCRVESVLNSGSLSGLSEGVYIGGIAAYAKNDNIKTTVINAKNTADITAEVEEERAAYTVAGILAAGPCNAERVYNSGNIKIRSTLGVTVGGILGNSSHSSVSRAVNCGNVSVVAGADANAGGIYAVSIYSEVTDAINSGDVYASGKSSGYAGGISSQSRSRSSYVNVINLGNISGDGNVGSISGKSCDFGSRFNDTFANVYAKASAISAIGSGSFSDACTILSDSELADPSKLKGLDFESTWTFNSDGIPTLTIVKTVSKPEPILGDADGDGDISLADFTRMCRSIAGWNDTEIIEANCDFNGDGVFDTVDTLLLMRMLIK